eukprot:scaffold1654_cov340-Prasinococcus_capsulatus_cf.AAC.11
MLAEGLQHAYRHLAELPPSNLQEALVNLAIAGVAAAAGEFGTHFGLGREHAHHVRQLACPSYRVHDHPVLVVHAQVPHRLIVVHLPLGEQKVAWADAVTFTPAKTLGSEATQACQRWEGVRAAGKIPAA